MLKFESENSIMHRVREACDSVHRAPFLRRKVGCLQRFCLLTGSRVSQTGLVNREAVGRASRVNIGQTSRRESGQAMCELLD